MEKLTLCVFVKADPTVPASVPPEGIPTIILPLTDVYSEKPVGVDALLAR